MNYEKKYKDALEKLHEALAPAEDGCKISGLTRDCLENIFPELKSEDEQIRRAIIAYIDHGQHNGVSNKDMIAWLEKQDKQKTPVYVPKFRVGDIVKKKSQPMLDARKIHSIDKGCYWCEDKGCIGFAWEDDYELVEQKHAWSEEDEKFFNDTIAFFERTTTLDHADWLKSLKQRIGG